MCPDRDVNQNQRHHDVRNDEKDSQRLPPMAAWFVRGLCLGGLITILISLPMDSDYGMWTFGTAVSPTWRLVLVTLIISAFLIITIPFAIWWLLALVFTITWALAPRGPKVAILRPLFASGLLIAWVAPWLSIGTWQALQRGPLWGSFVFAIGFTLLFFSTLPGLYYWIRRRLKRCNGPKIIYSG
jgi:hypothetical protein